MGRTDETSEGSRLLVPNMLKIEPKNELGLVCSDESEALTLASELELELVVERVELVAVEKTCSVERVCACDTEPEVGAEVGADGGDDPRQFAVHHVSDACREWWVPLPGDNAADGDTADSDTAEGDTAEGDTAEGVTAQGETSVAASVSASEEAAGRWWGVGERRRGVEVAVAEAEAEAEADVRSNDWRSGERPCSEGKEGGDEEEKGCAIGARRKGVKVAEVTLGSGCVAGELARVEGREEITLLASKDSCLKQKVKNNSRSQGN